MRTYQNRGEVIHESYKDQKDCSYGCDYTGSISPSMFGVPGAGDRRSGDMIGFYALIYLVAGYLNGLFEQIYFDEDIKLPLFLIAVSDLLYGLCIYVFTFLLRSDFNFLYYLNRIIIPEAIYTIVITLGVYPLLLFINHKLEAVEKRSASKFV